MGNCSPSRHPGWPVIEEEAEAVSVRGSVAGDALPLPVLLGRVDGMKGPANCCCCCLDEKAPRHGDRHECGAASLAAACHDSSQKSTCCKATAADTRSILPAVGDSTCSTSYEGLESATDDDSPKLPHSSSNRSIATSGCDYAESDQTLIFLDWDDTLCPTTELLRRGLVQGLRRPRDFNKLKLPADLEEKLVAWRKALIQLVDTARALSDHVAIVTCASSAWVALSIKLLVPELQPLLQKDGRAGRHQPGKIAIISATELLQNCLKEEGLSVRPFSRDCGAAYDLLDTSEERREQLTAAKVLAMKNEAQKFYSRYPGQTWKNVLSFGDMPYEYDAVKELPSCHVALARERLRIKAVQLPKEPSVDDLVAVLQSVKAIIPLCVQFDGNLDVDLAPLCVARRLRPDCDDSELLCQMSAISGRHQSAAHEVIVADRLLVRDL